MFLDVGFDVHLHQGKHNVYLALVIPVQNTDRASIGADGAIDACGEGCLGALSLSPGNYLGVAYSEAVNTLGAEQKPAWCVASKQDSESFPTCESAGGDFYQKFIYETSDHGMTLFEAGHDPKITQVIFDFLQLVFGG